MRILHTVIRPLQIGLELTASFKVIIMDSPVKSNLLSVTGLAYYQCLMDLGLRMDSSFVAQSFNHSCVCIGWNNIMGVCKVNLKIYSTIAGCSLYPAVGSKIALVSWL